MKKIVSVLMLVVLVISLAACSSGKVKETSGKDATKSTTIGLVMPTLTTDFFVTLKDAAVKYAAEKGIEINVLDSQNDAVKEAANVEDLITKKVAAILIIPMDSDAVVNSIKAANTAKIPVITLDRASSGGDVVAHISSDNISGGLMAGKYIVEKLGGKGKVVELEGVPGTSAARDRGEGFNKALEGTEITVVSKQTANFNKAEGMSVMENILQAQPEIDAVFAQNDEMALGAMEAITAVNRKDIMIVGFDASVDAVTAVKAGSMATTVAQKPDLIATTGIDVVLKVLAGEKVDKYIPIELELVVK